MQLLTSPFDSVAHALAITLRAAKERNEHEISIPYGIYHVYQPEAAAPVLCVANHGHNGYKSAALAIEDMEDLTVNGNGSTFILHGQMDFAVVNRSKNITIRDLTVTCADTCNFEGRVTAIENDTVTITLSEHPALYLHGNLLCEKINHNLEPLGRTLDYVTETKELRRGSGDENFGVPFQKLKKSLDGDVLTLYEVPVLPELGDTIVFTMSLRCNQAFLFSRSENILCENVTVHTCWGIAFIAQKCTDVTIRSSTVTPEKGRCFSAGQDATHFVNCRGTVTIENSRFENQLDDAVNLHGIYTLIEKVASKQILVRYGHFQTRGIDIYTPGDRIQILERESQQPLAFARILEVEVLSPDVTVLTLDDIEGDIKEGMIVENLSDEANAVIRGNVIRNNRARGMLIAAKGHIEITDNHFHSGGAAIQFESDPMKWFECGGVKDVLIENNDFDDCRHGKWSRAVIDINKRRKTVEGFYYHDRITVRNNRFTQTNVPCVCADNVACLRFEDNVFVCDEPLKAAHAVVNGELFE
ncbi:MAG: right-handed parallel beta-helix repeat-containing protein [Clostridia bacterium]|nr:right-handed parallel beta-helix repeat-containing protein [Clostridia bacterium]